MAREKNWADLDVAVVEKQSEGEYRRLWWREIK